MTIWARNAASITLNNESSMSPIYLYRAAGVHVHVVMNCIMYSVCYATPRKSLGWLVFLSVMIS